MMRLPQSRLFHLTNETEKKEIAAISVQQQEIAFANIIINTKGEIISTGIEFSELLGYTVSEIKKCSIWKFISHPSAIKLSNLISQLSTNQPFATTQIVLICKNQTTLCMEMMLNFSTIASEPQLFCTLQTNSSEKNISNTPSTLKNHYQLLAEFGDHVQMLLNAEFQVLFITPSCGKLSGYTSDEAMQLNLFSLIHPDDFDFFWDQLTLKHENNQTNFRFRIKKKEKGCITHIECQLFVITDEFNQPEYYVLNLRDISEQRKYEHELIRAHNEAEVSSQMKNNFLASITHELRTPLNAIIGFSRIINQSLISEDGKRYNGYIESSGLQLLGLIDNLLEYARIENNQVAIEKSELNIDDFFTNLSLKIRKKIDQLQKPQIELIGEWDIEQLNPHLVTNSTALANIFSNLLDNAIKFTNNGFIRYGCKPYGIRQMLFFVEDSGIGIPNDAHDLIFEKFTQLDQSLSREYGGTGLGLTVTKRLIDLLGGEIWVMSEKNKGASFYFKLPIENQ